MWIAHKFIHTHIRSHFKIDEPKSPQAALKENEKTKKQHTPVIPSKMKRWACIEPVYPNVYW